MGGHPALLMDFSTRWPILRFGCFDFIFQSERRGDIDSATASRMQSRSAMRNSANLNMALAIEGTHKAQTHAIWGRFNKDARNT
jgi:hypothetical protein